VRCCAEAAPVIIASGSSASSIFIIEHHPVCCLRARRRPPTPTRSQGSRQGIYTVSSCPHLGLRIAGSFIHVFFKPSPRGLHIEQRTYDISTGTGSLELSVKLFSPEIFTSNATSETATPSEHDAITRTFGPSSCNDLTVHF
jgi:hypothetical protein